MKSLPPLITLLALLVSARAAAQEPVPAPMAPDSGPPPALQPTPLEPFVATYQAYYKGKLAGSATMRVTHNQGAQWRVDLGIHGERGFAGVLGLNVEQSTVFDDYDNRYRPLSQSTVRKGLFLGKKVTGVYNWNTRIAHWQGDLKKDRTQPIPLLDGDMSALLINLAVMRDAVPGKEMHYRLVDLGRTREHTYQVSSETEIVPVGELSYSALRVWRVTKGDNETIVWVANGVPTPIRILQRDKGEDEVDLRLIEYQGV